MGGAPRYLRNVGIMYYDVRFNVDREVRRISVDDQSKEPDVTRTVLDDDLGEILHDAEA